ncbi:flagellar basal body rod protein FlgC [Cupriavidus sp. 8B]
MDYARAFAISAAGMAVERTRVDVAALNLANANTIVGGNATTFQPLRVVTQATAPMGSGLPSFADRIEEGLDALDSPGFTLPQARTEASGAQPRMVYEPGHPFADDKGFVAYQGVDAASEMVTLMGALRAYEANVAAMNTARTLSLKALDIGGTS